MPVKGIKAGSMADVLANAQKDFGDRIGQFGIKMGDMPRLPSGILPLDIALGGGIPRGRMSIIHGMEGSGKTNLAMCFVREHQRRFPDQTCAFVDAEHGLLDDWATKFGIDTGALQHFKPDYAEQVVDLVEQMIYAPDCGLIVIDSIAAMMGLQELDNSAEKAVVGGTGLAVGKLVRKCTSALGNAEKEDRFPTMVWLNQRRVKIGVMYGDPEDIPGGNGQKHMASMRIRLHSKPIKDPNVSKVKPVLRETSVIVKKHKVPVVSDSTSYNMVLVPHKGLEVGRSNDWPIAEKYLKQFGWVEKGPKGKGWVYDLNPDVTFSSQVALWEYLRGDLDAVRERILAELMVD